MHRLLAALLLGASVPAGAEIYKWTDANGRTHFGDSAAGAGQPAEAISPRAGAPASATPGSAPDAEQMRQRQRRLLETLQREEAERQALAAREADTRRRQERECQRTRKHLLAMEGRVLYTTGADGERQYLDDAQRQDYADNARRYLDQHCQ